MTESCCACTHLSRITCVSNNECYYVTPQQRRDIQSLKHNVKARFDLVDGPFSHALDQILITMKVHNEAYYSGTGNHVHKCIQVEQLTCKSFLHKSCRNKHPYNMPSHKKHGHQQYPELLDKAEMTSYKAPLPSRNGVWDLALWSKDIKAQTEIQRCLPTPSDLEHHQKTARLFTKMPNKTTY